MAEQKAEKAAALRGQRHSVMDQLVNLEVLIETHRAANEVSSSECLLLNEKVDGIKVKYLDIHQQLLEVVPENDLEDEHTEAKQTDLRLQAIQDEICEFDKRQFRISSKSNKFITEAISKALRINKEWFFQNHMWFNIVTYKDYDPNSFLKKMFYIKKNNPLTMDYELGEGKIYPASRAVLHDIEFLSIIFYVLGGSSENAYFLSNRKIRQLFLALKSLYTIESFGNFTLSRVFSALPTISIKKAIDIKFDPLISPNDLGIDASLKAFCFPYFASCVPKDTIEDLKYILYMVAKKGSDFMEFEVDSPKKLMINLRKSFHVKYPNEDMRKEFMNYLKLDLQKIREANALCKGMMTVNEVAECTFG